MKNMDFEIFNTGSSKTVKLLEVIEIIASKLGVNPKIGQLSEQLGDVPDTCADVSKAKKMLRYDPLTSIEEEIENFIEWCLTKRNLLEKKNYENLNLNT